MSCFRCGKDEQLRRGLCHACYERDRRAGLIEKPVSARAARCHIVLLVVNGWRYREIARAAGIDRSQVAWIVSRGRETITAKTHTRICSIDPDHREKYIKLPWDTRRANMRAASYEGLRAAWEARTPPKPIPQPGSWTRAALCAQVAYEMFFPEKGGSTRDPKRVCERCTVARPCLDFALENDIRYGIFGGLSVRERDRIQQRRESNS